MQDTTNQGSSQEAAGERETFFRTVLGNGLPDGLWAHVWHLDDWYTDWVRDVNAAEGSATRNGRQDVYFGTGLVGEPGGHKERVKKETATGLLAVLADIDVLHPVHKETALPPDEAAALALVDELGLPPTIVVRSGHGLQAWWLFTKPWRFRDDADRQRATRLSAMWQEHVKDKAAEHGWKLDAVGDLSRVLRLPGTFNGKERDGVVPVRLLSVSAEARYTPEMLLEACGATINTGDVGGAGTAANEDVSSQQRFTQAHPCPICGGHKEMAQGTRQRCWGFASSYVDAAFCTRWEHAGKLGEATATILGRPHWMHALHGLCECGQTHGAASGEPSHVHLLSAVERRAYALGYTLNDEGNARRFVDRFGRNFRHVMDQNHWIRFDGVVWRVVEGGEVEQAIRATMKGVLQDAWKIRESLPPLDAAASTEAIADRKAREKVVGQWIEWARQSGMGHHLDRALKIATTMSGIPVLQRQLNANPMLIGCLNGYYNLDTFEFTPKEQFGPQERAALVTMQWAANYDPDCPREPWDWTFKRFVPDEQMREDLKTAWAYSATGRPKEHVFICSGGTKTGKSTIENAVANAMGDYATETSMETFLTGNYNRAGGAREDLVALVGRRMVLASESNPNARLNAAQLKQMSGNDPLSLRANYGKQFTTLPTFAIWLRTNHEPKLAADDEGIWERTHLFKFTAYIAPEERDENERDRVTNPAVTGSAILNDVIDGWKRLRGELKGRLTLPSTVSATQDYRDAQDVIAQFVAECCVEGPEHAIKYSRLKRAFREYLKREDIHEQYTDHRISKALKGRGYEEYPSSGTRYRGVTLREVADAQAGVIDLEDA